MLQKLYIRNYAIIDELIIDFDSRLNVITGETGAGKSIILGALSLILGERADTAVLINTEEKCVIEAYFTLETLPHINQYLEANDIDIEPVLLIRREITPNGKSRAFVNDTPVTLTVLQELTNSLVDLHRQFDTRSLQQSDFLYEVVDAYGNSANALQTYSATYKKYLNHKREYHILLQQQQQWQKEADYKSFLFEELEEAAWKPQEIEESELSLQQLQHATQIKATLLQVHHSLAEAEIAQVRELKRLQQQLQHIAKVHAPAEHLAQRLESCCIELEDIAQEALALEHQMDYSEEAIERLAQRVDLGNKMLKKHGVSTTDDLIVLHDTLQQELQVQMNASEALDTLAAQVIADEQLLDQQAEILLQIRSTTAPHFALKVNQLLALVGMPNAQFKVEVQPATSWHEKGKDQIVFLFDANNSGKFNPIQKAASGGEMSRIMLCLKALTAEALSLPTLIFDEVDTGISGEVAIQVGMLLHTLAQHRQVICITHQPQVAGKGHQHYFVYKSLDERSVLRTRIKLLSETDRILAIAQMIGGEKPSVAAIDNAKELIRK
jgi:DNA repair protein RecN (Recombination protein N)